MDTSYLNRLFVVIGLFFCLNLQAQSSYHPNTFLIIFEPTATQADIDLALDELNSTELWISPLSQTRLWEVNSFPYYYPPTQDTLYTINQTKNKGQGRAQVNEAGLNYLSNQDVGAVSNNPSELGCYKIQAIEPGTYSTKIGIYDTGFNQELNTFPGYDFYMSTVSEYDWLDDDSVAQDDNGHGNHIRSVIADMVNRESSATGKAEVHYDIAKTFDASGNGYLAEIILALESNAQDGDLKIVNFSWSTQMETSEAYDSPLHTSLETVINANGILFVCAAGNEGVNLDDKSLSGTQNFPAAYDFENILAVTSYDCADDLTSFANFGSVSVDIAAAGIDIYGLNQLNNEIVAKNGTSQSTAIVTGVATSLATHQAIFDALEIKCAIMQSAQVLPNLAGKLVSNGVLDSEKALNLLPNCNPVPSGPTIITLGMNAPGGGTEIYPNPVADNLSLQISSEFAQTGSIKIISNQGQLIRKENIYINEGPNTLSFELEALGTGFYNLILEFDNRIEHLRFVKI